MDNDSRLGQGIQALIPTEPDLTAAGERAHRDALITRTDVLDRVAEVALLPDGAHGLTDQVAGYYGVDKDAVRQLVARHKAEFDDAGYRVVTRSVFESDIASLSNLDPKVRTIALFPRRAILLTGMLLRDSEVAKAVRAYLLDAEQHARHTAIPDISTPEGVVVMADMFASTARELVAAKQQIERERPLVERAKTHAAGTGAKSRQQFFRELKQWAADEHQVVVKQDHVMNFLSTRKLGLFTRGDRRDSGQATAWAIEHGYARNPEGTADNGHNFVQGVLTPRGQEYAWERCVRYIDANGTLALPKQIGGAA